MARVKKIPFVVRNNFHFVIDFSEERNFNNKVLNFKTISPIDRVLLSVYMTGLSNQKYTVKDTEEKKIEQMSKMVFDFNEQRSNNITNMKMTKQFKQMVAKFFIDKKDYCDYVAQDSIVKTINKENLFRVGLNATEYSITRKLKYKKLEYLLYTIYFLGTAKNFTSCSILNRFDLHNFSHCLKNSKKMVDKIFSLMNWKYTMIDKSLIVWKSKWKLELENNDLSKEDIRERKIAEFFNEE